MILLLPFGSVLANFYLFRLGVSQFYRGESPLRETGLDAECYAVPNAGSSYGQEAMLALGIEQMKPLERDP